MEHPKLAFLPADMRATQSGTSEVVDMLHLPGSSDYTFRGLRILDHLADQSVSEGRGGSV